MGSIRNREALAALEAAALEHIDSTRHTSPEPVLAEAFALVEFTIYVHVRPWY